MDIQDSEDPEGLRVFYYLVQDLKVSFQYSSYPRSSLIMDAPVLDLLTDLPAFQDQAYIGDFLASSVIASCFVCV